MKQLVCALAVVAAVACHHAEATHAKPTLSVAPASAISPGTVLVRGTASAGAKVFVNRLPAAVEADGQFTALVHVSEGQTEIVVQAIDPATNESTEQKVGVGGS